MDAVEGGVDEVGVRGTDRFERVKMRPGCS